MSTVTINREYNTVYISRHTDICCNGISFHIKDVTLKDIFELLCSKIAYRIKSIIWRVD